jgi:hypothetical protein
MSSAFKFNLDHDNPPKFPNVNESAKFRDFLIYHVDPFNHEIAKFIRERILAVYQEIKNKAIFVSKRFTKFIVNPNDIERGSIKVLKFPSALISGYLTHGSVTMVEGSPGSGKTFTIEALSRQMSGTSIKSKINILHCNKSLDKDSWLAKIDPSDVIRPNGSGEWKVKWAEWVKNNEIIDFTFDEINRASEDIQAQMLLLMQEGMVQYDIDFSENKPDIRLFLTRNPSDEDGIRLEALGNAFKDRITQVLQVPQADSWAIERVEKIRSTEKYLGYDADDYVQPLLTPNMVRIASILSTKIPVNKEAYVFLKYLTRDSNLCVKSPNFEKSFNEIVPIHELCKDCHFNRTEFVCHKVSGGSFRIKNHLLWLAKSYAFWINIPSVNLNLLAAIAPDVISHRLTIPIAKLKEKKDQYFYDKRKYIENEYIQWCKEQVQKRRNAENAYIRLLNGEGKTSDLKILIDKAQNDLYIRLDKIPRVLEIDENELNNNMYEDKIKIDPSKYKSCVNPEYINTRKKISTLYKNKEFDELNNLLYTVQLDTNKPMRSLLEDILNEAISQLGFEIKKSKWGK